MTNLDRLLEKSRELRGRAHLEINSLAAGTCTWLMRIPVQKDDSDVVLQKPIDDSELKDQMLTIAVEALIAIREDGWIENVKTRGLYKGFTEAQIANDAYCKIEALAAKALGESES